MKNNIFKYSTFVRKASMLSVVVLTVLCSCKKDDTTIGADSLPESDKLNANTMDTLSIVAYTEIQDSVRTSNLSRFSLGNYVDQKFGNTSAEIYTQVRLSSDNVNFIPSGGSLSDIVLDSVVLSLAYQESTMPYYGTLEAQTFEVYELTNPISDSTHYSFQTISDNGINLVPSGYEIITPQPDSTFTINGDELSPQLRIRLDNSFGQKIINESGNSTVSNNTNFKEFIRGLRIKTNNAFMVGNGAILYFDPYNSDTKVTLYYRDTSGSSHDTLSFSLLINENANYFTHTTFDYFGTDVNAQLVNPALGETEFYTRGLGGLASIVKFPTLESLKDSNIIINKAELVLNIDNSNTATYPAADIIESVVADTSLEAFVNFNYTGQKIATYLSNEKYKIFLTDHINDIITGKVPNKGIKIYPNGYGVVANRVIFQGINSSNPPKLIITYTKYQ